MPERYPGESALIAAVIGIMLAAASVGWARGTIRAANARGVNARHELEQQLAKARAECDLLRERMDEALEHIHESRGAAVGEPEPGADPVS